MELREGLSEKVPSLEEVKEGVEMSQAEEKPRSGGHLARRPGGCGAVSLIRGAGDDARSRVGSWSVVRVLDFTECKPWGWGGGHRY